MEKKRSLIEIIILSFLCSCHIAWAYEQCSNGLICSDMPKTSLAAYCCQSVNNFTAFQCCYKASNAHHTWSLWYIGFAIGLVTVLVTVVSLLCHYRYRIKRSDRQPLIPLEAQDNVNTVSSAVNVVEIEKTKNDPPPSDEKLEEKETSNEVETTGVISISTEQKNYLPACPIQDISH